MAPLPPYYMLLGSLLAFLPAKFPTIHWKQNRAETKSPVSSRNGKSSRNSKNVQELCPPPRAGGGVFVPDEKFGQGPELDHTVRSYILRANSVVISLSL